ncbi:MAG: hypothetical protein AB1664_18410 [Thermodesulfobacteriota bacterium]
MTCFPRGLCSSFVVALLLASLVTSDCLADCIACWKLKGVRVRLKDGTRIKGYATWNDSWALFGYQTWSEKAKEPFEKVLATKKKFPDVIFDSRADIDGIAVYTHLRSVKYPVKNHLVAIREPIGIGVKDIQEIKLNPGPFDGYDGATELPVVSPRVADLLQTRPASFCVYDDSVADVYWVSYDKGFPAEELKRLCEERISDEEIEKKLAARDIFPLYFFYD